MRRSNVLSELTQQQIQGVKYLFSKLNGDIATIDFTELNPIGSMVIREVMEILNNKGYLNYLEKNRNIAVIKFDCDISEI